MEISPRNPSKRSQEPVDDWLQTEGYFRKHAPRDPTCLFRAVSEQVYLTQHYHIRVRRECVEFMKKLKHMFTENVTIPFDDYLEQMACFTEWGGMNEIQAMSLLYKREFIIFNGQMQISHMVTNNGFKDMIYLCYTPQKQYESIYSREFVANAAYCQSIVYQILYKNVFHMTDIEDTVFKMLHDRTGSFRHDKFFLKGNIEIREQLTTEMYIKLDDETDEVNEAQGVSKNIPPFPYRIAKALDPNIYRNTDFDIWHEIRREVKNAGWTRHNSHELQIGGKCLVQMDFNEEEFDKANNNSAYMSSLETNSNNNDTKVIQKKGKQDLVLFCGHIQEMSKNQGPVLVFIEELGEKKFVPYSALKPLPLKKTKQNNWLPISKKNIILDTNQKWKKPCGTTPRKIKETVSITLLPNDKNENNDDNNVTDINRNNFQQKEGSLMMDQHGYENYMIEKYPNYANNNSVSAKNVADNTQLSIVDPVKQENKERKEQTSFTNKSSENNMIKSSKSDGTNGNNNNAGFNSHAKQKMQKETYYPPYSGESTAQMDHVLLRSINCSVQKSVDVNGSDLPLSDPFTLRFFYNLGLEYFRGNTNRNYLTNGQSADFGQWYQEVPQNDMEISNIANMMQDCKLTEKKEHSNDHKETSTIPLVCNENGDKYSNGTKEVQTLKTDGLKEEYKNDWYSPRDKIKDQPPVNKNNSRINKSGLGPRFKKNGDVRHRFTQHITQPTNQYLSNGPLYSKLSKVEKGTKGVNTNVQHSLLVPQQVHTSTNAVNSYQVPYMQQGMYPGLTYYPNEAEGYANSYYATNTGYYPVPCVPHSEIPDNNNVQQFSPHPYSGVDYSQAYSGFCPSYVCPQPAAYTVPPQNVQEQWYTVAGQPHYMQYAHVMPVTAETPYNGITSNAGQNVSL